MPPPTVQDHITEAFDNYMRYHRMLEKSEDESWATVFLFYSAIHLIQAYALRYTPSDIPNDHESRADYIAYYLPDISEKYGKLYTVSRQVRYKLFKKTRYDIQKLYDEVYARVKNYLRDSHSIAWQRPNTTTAQQGGGEAT